MKRLLSFAVLALALIVTAHAQYRPSGPPASVTSSQPNPVTGAPLTTPGATVTSGRFSPVFPPPVHVRVGRSADGRHNRNDGRDGNHGRNARDRRANDMGWGYGYGSGYVEVPVPVPVDQYGNPIAMTDAEAAAQAEEEDAPAYTVFERRSRSAVPMTDYSDVRASMRPRAQMSQSAMEAQPEQTVPDQPATVLIFRDGRQLEITNYAIQSGTLFNLSDNGPRKIALADVDVDKTVKANDERGVDFTLPTAR